MIVMRIEGPNAEALAAEAGAFLAEVSGGPARREAVPPSRGSSRADPVAVAALVLSVPGAVVACLDLAQRLRLAERLQRFRDAAKARAGEDDRVELCVGEVPPLDVLAEDRDRLLDALTATGDGAP